MAVLDKAGLEYLWGKLKTIFVRNNSLSFHTVSNRGATANIDTAIVPGLYGTSTATAGTWPSGFPATYGTLFVSNSAGSGNGDKHQILYSVVSDQIYKRRQPGGSAWTDWVPVATGASLTQRGSVSISLIAGTTQKFTVFYPKSFWSMPAVVASFVSDAPASRNINIGTAHTTGFDAYINSETTYSTTLNWIAIG